MCPDIGRGLVGVAAMAQGPEVRRVTTAACHLGHDMVDHGGRPATTGTVGRLPQDGGPGALPCVAIAAGRRAGLPARASAGHERPAPGAPAQDHAIRPEGRKVSRRGRNRYALKSLILSAIDTLSTIPVLSQPCLPPSEVVLLRRWHEADDGDDALAPAELRCRLVTTK